MAGTSVLDDEVVSILVAGTNTNDTSGAEAFKVHYAVLNLKGTSQHTHR